MAARGLTPGGVKWYGFAMADLKVRNLDDRVAASLRLRARRHGISLEEEARRVLAQAASRRRQAVCLRAAALRAATKSNAKSARYEGTQTIRADRDAWG